MRTITKTDLLRSALAHWRDGAERGSRPLAELWAAIAAADHRDAESVRAALEVANFPHARGFDRNYCDECGDDCAVLVQLGEAPGHDTATARICPDCLRDALAMAEGEGQ